MDLECHSWGGPVGRNDLALNNVRELATAIDGFPFAALTDIRRDQEREGLVVDFQVELPQDPPVPIRSIEPLLIALSPDPNERPVVLALRKDFPEVLHLNLTAKSAAKELCIFEEDYREVKSRLTPRLLLDRIADWLARAAVEELHQPDQPLEPFLLTSDRIIFDIKDVVATSETPPVMAVCLLSQTPMILRAFRLPADTDIKQIKKSKDLHLLLPLKCQPWHSRLLNHQPENLEQLSTLLLPVGTDVLAEARSLISRVRAEGTFDAFKKHQLILIIELPKTRTNGGPVESTEWWSFIISTSIENLAINLGLIQKSDTGFGTVLGAPQSKDLDRIGLAALRPTFALSKSFAGLLSGGHNDNVKIAAVGAGALGSQTVLNLVRQGFAAWTVIDHDNLLPHNLARHALSWMHEGHNKAESLANEICGLLNDPEIAKALPFDVIRHGQGEGKCVEELTRADFIVDFSASHAVAHFLATADFSAPRICVFLSPRTPSHYFGRGTGENYQAR